MAKLIRRAIPEGAIDEFIDDSDGNENGEKRNRFMLAKQHINLHVPHTFLHISYPSLSDMKLPNFTRPLYRVGEHNKTQKFSFQLKNGPFDRIQPQKTLPTFDK